MKRNDSVKFKYPAIPYGEHDNEWMNSQNAYTTCTSTTLGGTQIKIARAIFFVRMDC